MYQEHFLSSGARPELKSKNVRRTCQGASLPSPCSDTSEGLDRQGDSRSDMLLYGKRCNRAQTKGLCIYLQGPRCEPVRSNPARKRLYAFTVRLTCNLSETRATGRAGFTSMSLSTRSIAQRHTLAKTQQRCQPAIVVFRCRLLTAAPSPC